MVYLQSWRDHGARASSGRRECDFRLGDESESCSRSTPSLLWCHDWVIEDAALVKGEGTEMRSVMSLSGSLRRARHLSYDGRFKLARERLWFFRRQIDHLASRPYGSLLDWFTTHDNLRSAESITILVGSSKGVCQEDVFNRVQWALQP